MGELQISRDQIKSIIKRHLTQVTVNCYVIKNEDAMLNELDDLYLEAFEQGQRDGCRGGR